jgi:hypothetical protein
MWRRFFRWLLRRPVHGRRLVVPLRGWHSVSTGQRQARADLSLWLEDRTRRLVRVPFLVDSGASVSRMSLHDAEARHRLHVSDVEVSQRIQLADRAKEERVRPTVMRVRFRNDPAEKPFLWPLTVVVGPASAVLGLGGVVADCRWVFDSTPRRQGAAPFGSLLGKPAPFGVFLLEELRPARRP